MTPTWEHLTDLLRSELAGYGGLLRAFEDQQGHLLRRDPDAVLTTSRSIEDLTDTLAHDRAARELCVRSLAVRLGSPPEYSLRQLLPAFPAEIQPLLDALIREINHLIFRVRRYARQNQTLLARTVDIHREMIATLRPGAAAPTYSSGGRVAFASTGHSLAATG